MFVFVIVQPNHLKIIKGIQQSKVALIALSHVNNIKNVVGWQNCYQA